MGGNADSNLANQKILAAEGAQTHAHTRTHMNNPTGDVKRSLGEEEEEEAMASKL